MCFDNVFRSIVLTPPVVAVSMYVAAMAWHVPSEQAIFSTGRRASSKLLEQVLSMLNKLPGAEERIVKSNQEMIWVSHPGGKIAKISSYPSCAKTLRGVGGNIVYMEEAAFMDLDVFYQVIVPLLEVRVLLLDFYIVQHVLTHFYFAW